jgi:5-methylcytosine-specific restriction endonuclease McrA
MNSREKRAKRAAVVARHGLSCHYCRTKLTHKTMTLDHVIPRSQGGSSRLENLVPACGTCNRCKSGLMPQMFVALVLGMAA